MVYGIGRFGRAYASVIGYAGLGGTSYTRTLYELGLGLATSVRFTSLNAGGRFEAGYTFDAGHSGMHVTPFVALQPTFIMQGSAQEMFSGVGPGLGYRSTSIDAVPANLGLQLDGVWHLPNGATLAPFARIAWMHDFSPGRNVPRNFAELPNATFDSSTLPVIRNAAQMHLGMRYRLGAHVSLATTFSGQLASGLSEYGGLAELRFDW